MKTVKRNPFVKVCLLGLVGCLAAFGVAGTALAGETTPEERAAQAAFEKPVRPLDAVTWTPEQYRTGAEYAARLSKEGPVAEGLQPYGSVRWTADQFRAGAEYAALLEQEGPLPDGRIAGLKARMQPADGISLAAKRADHERVS